MIRMISLPNGVRIATDSMESIRTCALGVWVEIGSRHERPDEAGLTHFIEHMFFKGTTRLDAIGLGDAMDRLGGQFNAHTTQENLCLHVRCIDDKAPAALDLLCEMLLDSTFAEDEIKRERNVILEEYKMYEDSPEDTIFDLFLESLWPKAPLGRPIIGSPRTIRRFSSPAVREFLAREFDPSRILVAVGGHFDAAEISKIVKRRLGGLKPAKTKRAPEPDEPIQATRLSRKREVEQAHFCMGAEGPPRGSQDRFAFGFLNMILGGGVSSRLFREVREKRGLVYSIQSFVQPFRGAGCFGVAGSTSPENLREVIELSAREVKRMCEEQPSADEVEMIREQFLDSILMSLESASSRMSVMAEGIMAHGRPIPVDKVIREIKAVKPAHILRAAEKYIKGRPVASALIGPKDLDARGVIPRAF